GRGGFHAVVVGFEPGLPERAHHQLRVAGGVFHDEDAEDVAPHQARSRRYRPVAEPAQQATLSGVPWATTRPPASPAPGPMSMIQSARSTTPRWCSITTTVCPAPPTRPTRGHKARTSSTSRPVAAAARR